MDELKAKVLALLDELYNLGVEDGKKLGVPPVDAGEPTPAPVVDVEAAKAEERARILSVLKELVAVENADLAAKVEGLFV